MTPEQAAKVRSALRKMPKASAASIGSPPSPDAIYALPAHSSAIDPDVSLVIGNRGMGKTFWASALFDPETRAVAARAFSNARSAALDNLQVRFAFADREGVQGVSSDAIARQLSHEPEDIWRGLILHQLGALSNQLITFPDATALVSDDPERARALFRMHDQMLLSSNSRALLLIDQLDQLADSWPKIQRLTKGLLRAALAMKSYRNIRLKIFMRTDQAADEELFRFADASKIWGEAARLRWYSVDLYGLVYNWIWRDDDARVVLSSMLRRTGRVERAVSDRFGIPSSLAADPELQGTLFDEIAGDKMGGGSKRGRPYSWIPAHLADGVNEISPRSFVTALSVAADRAPETSREVAVDYKRIQEGVRAASEHRRRELLEDYPWIEEALQPLHGMSVPVDLSEIKARWRTSDVPNKILAQFSNTKAPLEVLIAPKDAKSRLDALGRALDQIGIFEERTDARVNIPDIFRIAAGIKRKGGITPQQRRRI